MVKEVGDSEHQSDTENRDGERTWSEPRHHHGEKKKKKQNRLVHARLPAFDPLILLPACRRCQWSETGDFALIAKQGASTVFA
jgi:hypothetical protein